MKRARWLLVDAIGVVAVTALLVWPIGPCRATFEQVREGMTLEEIVATVCARPGDYSDHEASEDLEWRADPWYRENRQIWITRKDVLLVEFGPDGRATRAWLWEAHLYPRRSYFDRLRDRLGW